MKNYSSSTGLFLWVGAGGALGALSRYITSFIFIDSSFPYSTLSVNLAGCFLITYLTTRLAASGRFPDFFIVAVTTGFLGSLTTYSTFALETILLFEASFLTSLSYILVSIIGGLGFCWLGYKIAGKKKVTE